jgi:TIR domain
MPSILSPEERATSTHWLQHASHPAPKPGLQWDVFISYRSVNRKWALSLYDTLREAGYDVFLDQYELASGIELTQSLTEHLTKSASAVLVWTDAATESNRVNAEYQKMRTMVTALAAFMGLAEAEKDLLLTALQPNKA